MRLSEDALLLARVPCEKYRYSASKRLSRATLHSRVHRVAATCVRHACAARTVRTGQLELVRDVFGALEQRDLVGNLLAIDVLKTEGAERNSVRLRTSTN